MCSFSFLFIFFFKLLAPQSHCDPIKYSYNDSLDEKTLDAHNWINGNDTDKGCEDGGQLYNKGVR